MKEKNFLYHIVKWENYGSNTFLYGTSLKYISEDSVFFENELMSSGVKIKSWNSKTNYQADRITPKLPILIPGRKYRISSNMIANPENTIYIRINFYDRYNKLISFENIRERSYIFRYPKDVNYYTVELLNASNKNFEFHSLIISDNIDVEFCEDFYISEIGNKNKNSEECNIVFIEPEIDRIHIPHEKLSNIDNIAYICSTRNYAKLYIDDTLENKIRELIDNIINNLGYKRINFIGYGFVGNIAALYYGIIFKNMSKPWITSTYYSEEKYNKIMNKNKNLVNVMELIKNNKDMVIEIYDDNIVEPELFRINEFLRFSEVIEKLPMYEEKKRRMEK